MDTMNEAERDPADFRAIKKRADKARDFPTQTDPCSRHAYLIAANMVTKGGYPMLSEEPWHCAISIMATVACLWETRAELARTTAIPPALSDEQINTAMKGLPKYMRDFEGGREALRAFARRAILAASLPREPALSMSMFATKADYEDAVRRQDNERASVHSTERAGEAVQRPVDGER